MGRQEYIADLENEIDVLYDQLSACLDSAQKVRIKRQIKELEQEKREVESDEGKKDTCGVGYIRLITARARLEALISVAEIIVENESDKNHSLPTWLKRQIQLEHDRILDLKSTMLKQLMG